MRAGEELASRVIAPWTARITGFTAFLPFGRWRDKAMARIRPRLCVPEAVNG